MKLLGYSAFVLSLAGVCSCGTGKDAAQLTKSGLDPQKFESVINGDSTALITLSNASGMEVCVTNYGGRIVSIMVPDKNGEFKDVVLGFDSVGAYTPEVNYGRFVCCSGIINSKSIIRLQSIFDKRLYISRKLIVAIGRVNGKCES